LHFERVQEYLTALGLIFHVDHRLVRGLDYYTRTVFEIQSREEGAQNALGGGGRYDDLIEALGGKPTPAVGFAVGMERIISNLKAQNVSIPGLAKPRVFVAYLGEEAKIEAMKLSSRLRMEGIGVMEARGDKSLKTQLRQANAFGTGYTVIIGKKEVESGSLLLRNMGSGEQRSIAQAEIVTALTESF
jgi:histidyl-tRNA synthetase